MAKFTSFIPADTVGSPTEPVTVPTDAFDIGLSSVFIEYTSNYLIVTASGDQISYIMDKSSIPFFEPMTNEINSIWEAGPGNGQSAGVFLTLLLNPATTTDQIQQTLFAFDDKIRGSDFDDKLCGWEGNDKLWGFDGRDEFFYGKGMGKDTICDYEKNDEIVLDTSVAKNFKKLKNVKYNEKKDFAQIKAGSGDKLKVYGIDTQKELKKALTFEDFTDFA